MNANWSRNAFVYLLIIVAAATLFINVYRPTETPQQISLTQLANKIKAGEVETIVVRDDELRVVLAGSNTPVISRRERSVPLTQTLTGLGVKPAQLATVNIKYEAPGNAGNWISLIINLLPLLFIGGLFFILFRQTQGSNNQALSFGKSRARVFTGDKPTVKFDDVAGADEAKEELKEVVEFLKEPQKFAALGARIPKGVLLVGPPGTGKTLMAKAVSGEAGVPFFSISGSEFVEMFVGVGASRVRDLFEQAKRNSPCIIFIDEIDAVGRYRGTGLGGSHDEREQTLNQILVEMDGFGTDTNVILIAATNRPDILDPALLRPGRFDRRVTMDRPDVNGRRAILDVHVRGKPIEPNVDLDLIARQTPGFVGADLENVVNEAAILAARRNKRAIGMAEFQEAIERVGMGGPERRSRLMTPQEKKVVAYHEAGHALVSHFCKHSDPLHKVTIVPRGGAGGYVWRVAEKDRLLAKRSYFLDNIAVALGGRVAEELVFGDVSNGAAMDIQQLTQMARAMITKYGMSEKMGPLQFGQQEELVFLGRDLAEQRDYSEEVAEAIDAEVQELVSAAYARVRKLLSENLELLHKVANALLERETLSAEEFREVVASA
ncbi:MULTISPECIES: ATP-dependent zinc metalloprotease FtsH [Caldilinea]|jgi:cell division protease FtsH|uniref:ATP-dependent zinc metalloprotease FtsH n=1 Tax=Caldilinea aerophila (strain DSM 14535 / JCM 11387 / NBRC 104270 / STL-6-O1) TaxID=926550 RepID=I0I8P1_CALAS|nr:MULTISPECIES: ATP-dependent zinc metalloprotease FtsH [Caldilinea]MBO9392862.1 ATP-dependent zinc metalloprotease FtsH [Caldilinea sp.]BAM01629.1 cell division protein FtsH [Caldilinea aerophila DSM 14535 = NBRC 104270]GIV72967.1 MAG: ATP-dependent zinc metalloprotease FtsH [Caldilinea sp.]